MWGERVTVGLLTVGLLTPTLCAAVAAGIVFSRKPREQRKRLREALNHLADLLQLDNGDAGASVQSMDCVQADALAEVLALAGRVEAASAVIALHSVVDDDDQYSRHAPIGERAYQQHTNGYSPVDSRGSAIILAREYVGGLIRAAV